MPSLVYCSTFNCFPNRYIYTQTQVHVVVGSSVLLSDLFNLFFYSKIHGKERFQCKLSS